ncbi:hypothetical protein M662_18890 [Bacillus sp. SB49]|uniref:hypothetical protein n=1 Tax=Bacillus sp. SB49 TaxID=1071080 RepID=UPI000408FF9B|nr:hypothetical protein [Bacillus sp. SB49]QHT48463.1 hypothetical protein M662_18890 [Bacillus sp. SB49]
MTISNTMENFHQHLQTWIGTDICITKHELRDQDAVSMQLHDVSYSVNPMSIDGYMGPYTLYLHGKGYVSTDMQGTEPLPTPYYEIPLEETTHYEWNDDRFFLKTARGDYTIARK